MSKNEKPGRQADVVNYHIAEMEAEVDRGNMIRCLRFTRRGAVVTYSRVRPAQQKRKETHD